MQSNRLVVVVVCTLHSTFKQQQRQRQQNVSTNIIWYVVCQEVNSITNVQHTKPILPSLSTEYMSIEMTLFDFTKYIYFVQFIGDRSFNGTQLQLQKHHWKSWVDSVFVCLFVHIFGRCAAGTVDSICGIVFTRGFWPKQRETGHKNEKSKRQTENCTQTDLIRWLH